MLHKIVVMLFMLLAPCAPMLAQQPTDDAGKQNTEVEEVNTAATRACVEMALRVGWLPPENAAPDVTAVLIAFGYNRLFALRHFLYRWRG